MHDFGEVKNKTQEMLLNEINFWNISWRYLWVNYGLKHQCP